MEINYNDALTQDSLFLLELCPVPRFPPNSAEQSFSQKWLDHLCTYQVEDLDDRRLRNIYISHLCTALIQRQLYGPFTKDPPKGKLEKVDFHATAVCPNTTFTQIQQPIDHSLSMSEIQQPSAHSTMQQLPGGNLDITRTINTSQTNMCSPVQNSSYTIVNATKTINSSGTKGT